MDTQQLVAVLLIGAIAGWLAGSFIKGGGFGIIGNIIIGILGAVVGGWLFGKLGIDIGGAKWVGPLVTATVGAIIVLVGVGIVSRK